MPPSRPPGRASVGLIAAVLSVATGAGAATPSPARDDRPNEQEQLDWLSHRADFGPFAPLPSYPSNRGFDQHSGVIWGVVNYFDPFSLVHNVA